MVSHDVVAFDLLSERGQPDDQGRAVRPGRRRGVRRLPLVPAAGRGRRASRRVATLRAGASSTATTPTWRGWSPTGTRWTTTRAWPSSASTCRRAGAETAVDAALRLDSEVMLVDDPVKRVDNMSMAWGLEARVPVPRPRPGGAGRRLPAGAEARRRRQGRAQGDRPADHPAGGDRPAQGLLPGAGDHPPRGQGARPGPRRADRRAPPASAGCSGPSTSGRLLADPNGELTPLRGNKLWQLGLLELWLQTHGV